MSDDTDTLYIVIVMATLLVILGRVALVAAPFVTGLLIGKYLL